ncbi:MAG: hypothetical protein FJ033_06785 [Chloroflexi bacterium]|nr:hypothetical protein [Chloroflexota bacterium]
MIAIVSRELLIGLRRGAPYAVLFLNTALLAGVAAAVVALSGSISPWVAPGIGATTAPTPDGIVSTLVAWRGPTLFGVLSLYLCAVATLYAPVIGARSISYERRVGSLDDLLGSGIRPLGIALGKLVAATAQSLLVLASGTPIFALVWIFGGVPSRVVVLSALILVGWTLLMTALGLTVAACGRGDVLPAAFGVALGAILLLGSTLGFVVALVIGRGASAALVAMSPLLALLLANGEHATAIAERLPGATLTLPLHISWTVGDTIWSAPLPGVAAAGFALLAFALLPLAGMAIDPYHAGKVSHLAGAGSRT